MPYEYQVGLTRDVICRYELSVSSGISSSTTEDTMWYKNFDLTPSHAALEIAGIDVVTILQVKPIRL